MLPGESDSFTRGGSDTYDRVSGVADLLLQVQGGKGIILNNQNPHHPILKVVSLRSATD
jgi:hypothetical protein